MKESSDDEVFAHRREQMVVAQIESRGIKNPLILQAMKKVPRHLFVAADLQDVAYTDGPLPIGHEQTISQPYIVALMTELLNLKRGEKVLEIGTGSGYQAAVLAEICSQVYSIEIVEPLALKADETLKKLGYKNVEVKVGDGYQGWEEHAPFDGIILTAAPDHIPQPLYDQLKLGARMVLPIGNGNQELMVITKTPEGMKKETVIPVRFVRMTGEAETK
ncbi:MAG: protein-L-isoaspartate O-methyltransferase [candidate division Zixibacteria bacterium RBG_19FT_COMBO_42_43]|nr:MAG: protein-L-isoaspartate O-methyltransferase [candidate division Zixibacteria bacterium RBG_19FT_COMBO_42_43]